MDYSHMAPGGLIPQLGGGGGVIPEDIDFSGGLPGSYPQEQEDMEGDVPSYMQEVEREPDEPEMEEVTGKKKKGDDGREWVITHWCDVCKVGLCSQRQYDVHVGGKPHEKKVKAMNENSLAYGEFLRRKEFGEKRNPTKWKCDICDITLADAEQYQLHLKGKPHEKKIRVKAGNQKVFDYVCDLCDVVTGSNRIIYDNHLDGQKHQKRLYMGKMDVTLADPCEAAYYCEICKIQMDCASQYISHLGGQQHMKRLHGHDEDANSGLLSTAGARPNTYWCDVCKISMSGHQPFEAHMNGAKHKAKVATSQQPPQQQQQQQQPRGQKRGSQGFARAPYNIPFISGQDSPQQIPQVVGGQQQQPRPPKQPSKEVIINQKCDICNVLLKTQSTYDAHIAGQLHIKRKKMFDSMGGRVTMPVGSWARKILDTGPMIQDGHLFCVLCDMKFTSLALALDHFPARKHKSKLKLMELKHEGAKYECATAGREGAAAAAAEADTAKVPTVAPVSEGGYGSFVSGGLIASIGSDVDVPDVVGDKADIDAKIKEARMAAGETEADIANVDAHVQAYKMAQSDSNSHENTPEVNAEDMDLLVKEISPHDTTAIICDVCNIGVTTTQMLENHVVGSKHIKKVLQVAINDGKDVGSLRGKGIPFRAGRMGLGRGRGRGFPRGGGGGGGPRGGRGGRGGPRKVVSTAQVMETDNDGSSFDYTTVKYKPPIGYNGKPANIHPSTMLQPSYASDSPGWTSWSDNNYQPGSGGWTPWTG